MSMNMTLVVLPTESLTTVRAKNIRGSTAWLMLDSWHNLVQPVFHQDQPWFQWAGLCWSTDTSQNIHFLGCSRFDWVPLCSLWRHFFDNCLMTNASAGEEHGESNVSFKNLILINGRQGPFVPDKVCCVRPRGKCKEHMCINHTILNFKKVPLHVWDWVSSLQETKVTKLAQNPVLYVVCHM